MSVFAARLLFLANSKNRITPMTGKFTPRSVIAPVRTYYIDGVSFGGARRESRKSVLSGPVSSETGLKTH